MKVILQSDVKKLGNRGDLVKVAEGYARNYLIPRGLAVVADEGNLKQLKTKKSQAQAKKQREREEARQLAESLERLTIRLSAKTGESGRLFGSITAGDIAEAVKESAGYEIDRRKIQLSEPIKELGTFEIPVSVYSGITATLRVDVAAAPGDTR